MTRTDTPKSFLFATWEGGGSVAPAVTVARKLVARGHRVRVMSDRASAAEAAAAGAEFTPWTRAPSRPDRSRESEILKDWAEEGPDGLRQTMDVVWTGPALAYAQDVMAELRREPADLVVSSEMLFGVMAGCEALGQQFCLLAVNVSIFPLPGCPPLGPGLPPARTPEERAMHAELAAFNVELFDHGLPAVNAARAALGLPPLAHTFDQALAAERLLLATSRAFDFEPDPAPAHIEYVGPQLGEPAWTGPWTSPWPAEDPRPLVLVGFSTTFQNHAPLLRRLVEALSALEVRAVVTLGGAIRPDEVPAPANVQVVETAPHGAIMRQAAAVATHGGHGTVCRALAHGLPMLVIPHGRDQNDNAARVAERGAGLRLTPDASVEELRAALRRLLEEPAFAEAARRLGAAVAREAEDSPVVEMLETLAAPARALCPA